MLTPSYRIHKFYHLEISVLFLVSHSCSADEDETQDDSPKTLSSLTEKKVIIQMS